MAGCLAPADPAESAIKQSIVSDCSSLPQMSTPIDPSKEITIRDVSVVDDPCRTAWTGTSCASNTLGRWTFGHFMAAMSGNADPTSATARNFVKNWLAYWLAPQTVNPARPQTVAPRPLIGGVLLFRWLQASGCTSPAQTTLDPAVWLSALQACNTLDLKAGAPFRLLGIANRIDLDGRDYSGNNGVPGELRFVFGIYNTAAPTAMSGNAEVIFEYRYPNTFPNQWWASMFHNLSGVAFGASFNNQLQSNITDLVTEPGAQPGGPNGGSAIGQIRTTENAFDASPVASRVWEFRQFGLPACGTAACPLVEAPVSQTPPTSDNNSQLLTDFLTANQAAISTSHHVVPASMLGGSSLSPSASSPTGATVWNTIPDINTGHKLVDRDDSLFSWTVRHNFAFSTCNGCHYLETSNFNQQFHFGPRAPGGMSQLSPFLSRTITPDPARNGYPQDMLSVNDPNLDSIDPFNGTPIYFQYNEIWRRSCEIRRVYFQTQQAPFTTPTGHN